MGDNEKEEKKEQLKESGRVENELENYESQIQKFQNLLSENEEKYIKARSNERDLIMKDIDFCQSRIKYYKEQREEFLSKTPKIVFPSSSSLSSSTSTTPLSSRFFSPPPSSVSSSSSSSSSSGVFETPALSLPSSSPFALTSSKGEKKKENEKGMSDPVAKASIDVKVKGSNMPTLVVSKSSLVEDYLRWRVSAREIFEIHRLPLDVIKIYLRSMLPEDVMCQVSKSIEYAQGDLDEIFALIQEIVLGPKWRCLLSEYERNMCKGKEESYTAYVFRVERVWKEMNLDPLSTDESYCSRALGRGLDRFGREFLELGNESFGGGGYVESRRLCVSLDTSQAFHSYRDLALLKYKYEKKEKEKKKDEKNEEKDCEESSDCGDCDCGNDRGGGQQGGGVQGDGGRNNRGWGNGGNVGRNGGGGRRGGLYFVQCFNCGLYGHKKYQCRSPPNLNMQRHQPYQPQQPPSQPAYPIIPNQYPYIHPSRLPPQHYSPAVPPSVPSSGGVSPSSGAPSSSGGVPPSHGNFFIRGVQPQMELCCPLCESSGIPLDMLDHDLCDCPILERQKRLAVREENRREAFLFVLLMRVISGILLVCLGWIKEN